MGSIPLFEHDLFPKTGFHFRDHALKGRADLPQPCSDGKFYDVSCRPRVLGSDNCLDQKVQGRTSMAARPVVAAQIVAGSFKMEVRGGKVALHKLLLIARRSARMADSLYPKANIHSRI
jgi:hypothetical protein